VRFSHVFHMFPFLPTGFCHLPPQKPQGDFSRAKVQDVVDGLLLRKLQKLLRYRCGPILALLLLLLLFLFLFLLFLLLSLGVLTIVIFHSCHNSFKLPDGKQTITLARFRSNKLLGKLLRHPIAVLPPAWHTCGWGGPAVSAAITCCYCLFQLPFK
jgi:hypothetical protein